MERRNLCRTLLVGVCSLLTGCAYSGNGLWVMGQGLERKRRQQDADAVVPAETSGSLPTSERRPQEATMPGRDE